MSERVPTRSARESRSRFQPITLRKVTAGALALGLIAGCANKGSSAAAHWPDSTLSVQRSGNAPKLPRDRRIPRCYDHPLPAQYDFAGPTPPPSDSSQKTENNYYKRYNNYLDAIAPNKLVLPIKHGRPEGMPTATPDKKLDDSIVKVSFDHGQTFGSGFLVDDSYGNEVVVTAAHVGAVEPLEDYTISDMAGQSVHPTGGCYIFENTSYSTPAKDSLYPLPTSEHGAASVDVAVLTLPRHIGGSVLQFAQEPASRGSWVKFTNFQYGSTLKSPADYYGLVDAAPPYEQPDAYTGLITYPNANAAAKAEADNKSYTGGGASGGVVTEHGKVEGMSYAYSYPATSPRYVISNISFPGAHYGYDTGFLPIGSPLISDRSIEAALDSARA